jgi:two-component system sensor histidine kinase ChvG
MLVGVFIALPIVLYSQFESADRQTRDLVIRAIQDRSSLIASALTPALKGVEAETRARLNEELARYGSNGTILKLMFQPAAERAVGRFYFVASAPPVTAEDVVADLDELANRGVLQRLSDTCRQDVANEIRYRRPGAGQMLTSIIPIQTSDGCWVLTSTHTTSEFLDTSIGRPYWQTREIRIAALIYLVGAAVALLVAVSFKLTLGRFRDVAAEISQGRIGDFAFSRRNVVPELSSVARDFDKLVHDLRRVSQQIRQSAEDNAHSFKTPLAAVRSALEPVRRAVPADDRRACRAIEIIDISTARLLDLVIAAQRYDNSTADLIGAPRVPTDLTQVVADAALHFRELLASTGIRLVRRLDERAIVWAGPGMLETALQNILENAISFSPRGSSIVVTLRTGHETIDLQVDDDGPGVAPSKIDSIFERYYSSRPDKQADANPLTPGHAGLGLWIVKRNIEALGGRIEAGNRSGGGFSVTVTLPRHDP